MFGHHHRRRPTLRLRLLRPPPPLGRRRAPARLALRSLRPPLGRRLRRLQPRPQGERFFGRGDLKYVILDLLKDQPRHGYDIIRALEDRMRGHYRPSPGSVYPTLQMLEDLGYVTSSQQEGKKVYSITDEGRRYLAEQQSTVDDIRSRITAGWDAAQRPEVADLMHELQQLAAGAVPPGHARRAARTPSGSSSCARSSPARATRSTRSPSSRRGYEYAPHARYASNGRPAERSPHRLAVTCRATSRLPCQLRRAGGRTPPARTNPRRAGRRNPLRDRTRALGYREAVIDLAPGVLLIAPPDEASDAMFARTVILVVDREPNGITTAIAINRPLPEQRAMDASALVLRFLADPSEPANWGGPMGHDPAILAESPTRAASNGSTCQSSNPAHSRCRTSASSPLPSTRTSSKAASNDAACSWACASGSNQLERELEANEWLLTRRLPTISSRLSRKRLWQQLVTRASDAL